MKTLFLSLFLLSSQSIAQADLLLPRVIYGEDNREEPVDISFANANIENAKRSTAALISRVSLEGSGDTIELYGEYLSDRFNVCSDERFSDQLAVSDCSGVLVAPNLILTASHCIVGNTKNFCKNNRWVFNYTSSSETVSSNDIYSCTNVLEKVFSRKHGIDWALVSLDRIVEDRSPVKVNFEGALEKSDKLIMMGHPSGLPLKVTTNGTIRRLEKQFIVTDFDSFSGNSGSPVLNEKTGLLEGILVQGEEDYIYDRRSGCSRPRNCSNDNCSGEYITLSKAMYNLKKYIKRK